MYFRHETHGSSAHSSNPKPARPAFFVRPATTDANVELIHLFEGRTS